MFPRPSLDCILLISCLSVHFKGEKVLRSLSGLSRTFKHPRNLNTLALTSPTAWMFLAVRHYNEALSEMSFSCEICFLFLPTPQARIYVSNKWYVQDEKFSSLVLRILKKEKFRQSEYDSNVNAEIIIRHPFEYSTALSQLTTEFRRTKQPLKRLRFMIIGVHR